MVQLIGTSIKMLSVAAVIGLLSAGAAAAQQRSPYDTGGNSLSPGRSNCNSPTGCANYPTGDVSKTNPAAEQQSSQPYSSQGNDLSPAKSNCGPDDSTCANYPTGNQSKANPQQQK